MYQDMLGSSLMRISSVSWCLGLGPPFVHTCRRARGCGAPCPMRMSKGARLSTCRGQMVRHAGLAPSA